MLIVFLVLSSTLFHLVYLLSVYINNKNKIWTWIWFYVLHDLDGFPAVYFLYARSPDTLSEEQCLFTFFPIYFVYFHFSLSIFLQLLYKTNTFFKQESIKLEAEQRNVGHYDVIRFILSAECSPTLATWTL